MENGIGKQVVVLIFFSALHQFHFKCMKKHWKNRQNDLYLSHTSAYPYTTISLEHSPSLAPSLSGVVKLRSAGISIWPLDELFSSCAITAACISIGFSMMPDMRPRKSPDVSRDGDFVVTDIWDAFRRWNASRLEKDVIERAGEWDICNGR